MTVCRWPQDSTPWGVAHAEAIVERSQRAVATGVVRAGEIPVVVLDREAAMDSSATLRASRAACGPVETSEAASAVGPRKLSSLTQPTGRVTLLPATSRKAIPDNCYLLFRACVVKSKFYPGTEREREKCREGRKRSHVEDRLTRRWPETDGRAEEERGLFRGLGTQGGHSSEGGAQ